MVTITRRLAQQFRAVLRRALGQVRVGPAIGFIADREGLTVKCMSADAAIELHVPGARAAETVWLPLSALNDFEGKKDDPVELTATGEKQIAAQWRDGNVPQIVQYDSAQPPDADKFPAPPTDFATNAPGLLQALHEASEVTDPNSSRFAIGCLQLCPDGAINATDGRQGLIQTGFTFPWTKPLLIPRNKIFHSPEVPQDKPVSVAQSDNWLVLGVDPWTIYLRADTEGRFPDVVRHVPDPANATARCQIADSDARFLADTLPRLPGNDEQNSPVTLDVNGHIAIRAKSVDQPNPTEVILTNSTCSGEPTRINTNRSYLKRAMKLGLRDVCLYGAEAALLGHADNRKLVWMPLTPDAAIGPTKDALRIESPKAEASASTSPSLKPKTERKPVSESNTNANAKAASNGQAKTETATGRSSRRKTKQQDIGALIEQAVKLRTALHDRMHEAGELVKARQSTPPPESGRAADPRPDSHAQDPGRLSHVAAASSRLGASPVGTDVFLACPDYPFPNAAGRRCPVRPARLPVAFLRNARSTSAGLPDSGLPTAPQTLVALLAAPPGWSWPPLDIASPAAC